MNSKERILTALNHEEPDRVPIYTSLIDSLDVLRGYDDYSGGERITQGKTVEAIKRASKLPMWRKLVKNAANQRSIFLDSTRYSINLYAKIGVDLLVLPVVALPVGKSAHFGVTKFGLEDLPPYTTFADEYGRIMHWYDDPDDPELYLLNYIGGMLDSETGNLEEIMAKYYKWARLDPTIKARYYAYEEGVNYTEEINGSYVIPGINGFLESTWQAFGFENYVKLLYEQPDFIREVTTEREEFARGIVELMVEKYSIETILVWDDLGYKTGTFLNPKQYKELIYPRMKHLVEFCHNQGVKVIHHTCGNINQILPEIIDTGIDGLNPLEPAAGMDAFQVKEEYGDQLTIVGNVDTIHLLAKGTPQDVEAYVKKLIRYCGVGGGLIVASGHSINPAVPYENYKAMIDTVFKYGTYPIEIND